MSDEKVDEVRQERLKQIRLDMIGNLNDYKTIKTHEDYKDLEISKPNTWIIDRSGLYLTVKNRIGEFTAKIDDEGIEDGGLFMKEKWKFYLPKIPIDIFHQIKAFFLDIADRMGNAEAYSQIYWDVQEEKYVVHIPVQKVSGGSVKYDKESELYMQDFDRYILVVEIHSHNTMGAFFSSIDDSDEKETRFYGVVGKIKDATPEYKFRFVVGAKKLTIDPVHLFEQPTVGYPAEWKDNVKTYGETTGIDSLDKPDKVRIVKTTSYGYENSDWYKNYRGYGYGYTGGYESSAQPKRYASVPEYVQTWLALVNPEKPKEITKTPETAETTTEPKETKAAGPVESLVRRYHRGEEVGESNRPEWNRKTYNGVHDYPDYGDDLPNPNEDILEAKDNYETSDTPEDKYDAIIDFVDCLSNYHDVEMLADALSQYGWDDYLVNYVRKGTRKYERRAG